jgi:hypothetical protein
LFFTVSVTAPLEMPKRRASSEREAPSACRRRISRASCQASSARPCRSLDEVRGSLILYHRFGEGELQAPAARLSRRVVARTQPIDKVVKRAQVNVVSTKECPIPRRSLRARTFAGSAVDQRSGPLIKSDVCFPTDADGQPGGLADGLWIKINKTLSADQSSDGGDP